MQRLFGVESSTVLVLKDVFSRMAYSVGELDTWDRVISITVPIGDCINILVEDFSGG